MTSFTALLGAAGAMGGLFAVGAGWARGGSARSVPLLSVGGVSIVGLSVAARVSQLAPTTLVPLRIVAATVVGGLSAWAIHEIHTRMPTGGLTMAPDIASLALLAAVVSWLTPPAPVLGVGPLAGWPLAASEGVPLERGLALCAVGVLSAWTFAKLPAIALPVAARWVGAGAATAMITAIAAPLGVATPQPGDVLTFALIAATAAWMASTPIGALITGLLVGIILTGWDLTGISLSVLIAVALPFVFIARSARDQTARRETWSRKTSGT